MAIEIEKEIVLDGHFFLLHEMEFLVSDESLYFSHYACEILHATDVACKSYKRKRSDSSVTTIITIHEFSLRFLL